MFSFKSFLYLSGSFLCFGFAHIVQGKGLKGIHTPAGFFGFSFISQMMKVDDFFL
jgi:hypothetical protein